MRSGLRGLGDLRFGLLRVLNIPASMYGNPHSVKNGIYQVVACIALRFVVGIGRKTLCFGRFPRQLNHSNACTNSQITSVRGRGLYVHSRFHHARWSVPEPVKPMVIRMLVEFPATRFPCDAATIAT